MSGPVWTPEGTLLKQHPVVGHLALLDHQLELLIVVLTGIHRGEGSKDPLTHQARGIVQMARILHLQIEAYREMLEARAARSGGLPQERRGP